MKGSEKTNKYFDLARELQKKTVEHEDHRDTNYSFESRLLLSALQRMTEGIRNKKEEFIPS